MAWTLSAFADEAGGSTEEQVKSLRRAGLQYIDLRGVDGFNITTLPVEKAKEVQKKLAAGGIGVKMFGSPLGKIDIADDFQHDLEKLQHLGKLAEIFGCRAVRIFSYYNRNGQPKDRWQAQSLSRLIQLRDEAKKLGLVLYHENESHIFGDRSEDCLTIAQKLRDEKTFKTIFDFSNFNIGGEDVWQCWQRLQLYTDAFHLKDSDQTKQHVVIGEGVGRARDILADALKRGWQGPLTLEPHLSHSKAVLLTGPSGTTNQAFEKLSPADSFHAAAEGAKKLLMQIQAPLAV